jgi:hypothetical protein
MRVVRRDMKEILPGGQGDGFLAVPVGKRGSKKLLRWPPDDWSPE